MTKMIFSDKRKSSILVWRVAVLLVFFGAWCGLYFGAKGLAWQAPILAAWLALAAYWIFRPDIDEKPHDN
jgi:hypothetical protein